MKISINENDIRLMVNSAVKQILSESRFGFDNEVWKGQYEPKNINDDNFNMENGIEDEMGNENREEVVDRIGNKIFQEIKQWRDNIELEKSKIQNWMNKKGIEPERQKGIMKNLLDKKHIRTPWILWYISDMDNLCLNDTKTNLEYRGVNPTRSYTEEDIERLFTIEGAKAVAEKIYDNTLRVENERINKRNQVNTDEYNQAKELFPEFFNDLNNLSYKELRDLYNKVEDKARQNPDSNVFQQMMKRVHQLGERMEKGVKVHKLGYANGWEKGGKEEELAQNLRYLIKQGEAMGGCFGYYGKEEGRGVSNTQVILLDDNGMPTDVYTWAVDSSD